MSTGKTEAQVRAELLADIEAIRFKRMELSTAAAICQHYDRLNASFNREIAANKQAIAAKKVGMEFGEVLRIGRRLVDKEEGEGS